MALYSAGCTQGGQLHDSYPHLHDLHLHTHGAHLSRSGLMSACTTSLRYIVDRHEGDLFLPASLWEPLGITEASFTFGLARHLQHLLSILLLELMRPHVSPDLLLSLRKVGEVLSSLWVKHPRSGSVEFTATLCYLSSMLGILTVRSHWLGGFRSRQHAARLTKGVASSFGWLLSRRGGIASEDEAVVAYRFVAMNCMTVFGNAGLKGCSFIYTAFLGANSYCGKTEGVHSSSDKGGLMSRWSQHQRALVHHARGTVSSTCRRTRYPILLHRTSDRFLVAFVGKLVPTIVASSYEALAITDGHHNANSLAKHSRRSEGKMQNTWQCNWDGAFARSTLTEHSGKTSPTHE